VALSASPHSAKLTSLDLRSNHIGAVGAAALAGSPHLANLTRLSLSFNPLGAAGGAALAGSPHFRPDMRIDLTESGFIPFDEFRRRELARRTNPR
jgi:hypothetical protein